MVRNTQGELIKMKQKLIELAISKELRCKEAAKQLSMHPNAFSRLKRRYLQYGVAALVPDKPGPKDGSPPPNRTPEWIEEIVCRLARVNLFSGPIDLADKLEEQHGIRLDQTTVYRILLRNGIRYGLNYKSIPKIKPKLYCMDQPGEVVQIDASYPYGRARKICCFSAIDDCSRYADGDMYLKDNALNAIRFVDRLVASVPFTIQKVKVDNRYGSAFKEHCAGLNIEVEEIDPYQPKQNGKVERYHKTLKTKFFWAHCGILDSKEEIRYKLSLWLKEYNYERKHQGYGMHKLTPIQKIALTNIQSMTNKVIIEKELKKITPSLQQYTN